MGRRTKKIAFQPIIFDTDVLIWYFRGESRAQSLLQGIEPDRRWISSLTMMELLQGCRNRDESLDVQTFVAENINRILHPRTSISEKAIHLVTEYSVTHGLRVVDALIAATVLLQRGVLVTGNERHFRFIPGLALKPFQP